jgi:hypothetical protein
MIAILRLGAEQAVVYGLIVIGVYELLVRWPVTRYERARRDRRAAEERVRHHQREQALLAQRERQRPIREREAAELEVRQQADPDPVRRRDYLACKSAEAERDAALEAGELHGPVFEPLADPDFFAQVRVDNELGTVVWPNGADLDPLVLHGDFEPASRLAHH